MLTNPPCDKTDRCMCGECSYDTPCSNCNRTPCYFIKDDEAFCSSYCQRAYPHRLTDKIVRVYTEGGRGTCNWPVWNYNKRGCESPATTTFWRDTYAGRMMDHADEYSTCDAHLSDCEAAVKLAHPKLPVVDKKDS
jgi:hypothetical protein